MYLLLIALSFFASVSFAFFLRRLDAKSPYTLARLKKIVSSHENALTELSHQQTQVIQDSFLEYEMLLQQSQQIQSSLRKDLEEYRKHLGQLHEEQKVAGEISTRLYEIADNTNVINEQMERIETSFKNLSVADDEIQRIRAQLNHLQHEIDSQGSKAEATLTEIIQKLAEEAEEHHKGLEENTRSSLLLLEDESNKLGEELKERGKGTEMLTEQLNSLSYRLDEKFDIETNRLSGRSKEIEKILEKQSDILNQKFMETSQYLASKLQEIEDHHLQRTTHLEEKLSEARKTGVNLLQSDLQEIRKEIENLNLETISRRDEILNDAKRLVQKVHGQTQVFQENYLAAQNDLASKIDACQQEAKRHISDTVNLWTEEHLQRTEKGLDDLENLRIGIEKLKMDKVQNLEFYTEELKGKLNHIGEKSSEDLEQQKKKLEEQLHESSESFKQDLEKHVKEGMQTHHELQEQRDQFFFQWEELKKNTTANLQDLLEEKSRSLEEQIERAEKSCKYLDQHIEKTSTKQENLSNQFNETCIQLERELKEKINMDSMLQEIGKQSSLKTNEMKAEIQGNLEEMISQKKEVFTQIEQCFQEWYNFKREMEQMYHMEGNSLKEYTEGLEKNIQSKFETSLENLKESFLELSSKFRADAENCKKSNLDVLEEKISSLKQRMHEQIEKAEQTDKKLEENSTQLIQKQEQSLISAKESLFSIEANIKEKALEITQEHQEMYNQIRDAANDAIQSFEETVHSSKHIEILTEKFEQESAVKVENMQQKIRAVLMEAEAERKNIFEQMEIYQRKFDGFSDYDHKLELIGEVKELTSQLENTLDIIHKKLDFAQKERMHIEEYIQNTESLRINRKEVESEIRLLESQRTRLTEAEKQMDLIQEKTASLGEVKELSLYIEKRIAHFNEFRQSFDQYFGEMRDRSAFIEKSLEQVEVTRNQFTLAEASMSKLTGTVERTEIRQNHLHEKLQKFETRAEGLESAYHKIQKVESRFEQMDGLMLDLEEKRKQISVMSNRVNEFEGKSNSTMKELDSTLAEADEKMNQLSSFYQLIEDLIDSKTNQNSETSSLQEKTVLSKKKKAEIISDHKKDGILSLYLNHKWSPELIAEKTRVDLSLVQVVISSHLTSSEEQKSTAYRNNVDQPK